MERFKGQKYENIRKHHQEMGVPWTDPTFPPSETSIGHSKSGKMPRIVDWKRPHVRFNFGNKTREKIIMSDSECLACQK